MKCTACGAPNPEKSRFCARCAQPLVTPTALGAETWAGEEVERAESASNLAHSDTHKSQGEAATATGASADFDAYIGRTIHGYRITGKLGEGAMGCVYKAEQLKLRRDAAIKVLPPNMSRRRDMIERFEREAQALAALDNPHIVSVFDMFEIDGHYCIAMAFCGGGSVKNVIARGRVPEKEAASIISQAGLGLWAAAQKGIVHRDVKPDNLLISSEGLIKVADFGLVKAAMGDDDIGVTKPGTVMGTPAFMAPEQWRDSHRCDHRSDLYSLGCTLFQMLSGRYPFQGPTSANLMEQHILQPPPDVRWGCTGISEAMAKIVQKMLEKDPTKRFQTGAELNEALAPFLDGVSRITVPAAAVSSASLQAPGSSINQGPLFPERTSYGQARQVGKKSAGIPYWPFAVVAGLALIYLLFRPGSEEDSDGGGGGIYRDNRIMGGIVEVAIPDILPEDMMKLSVEIKVARVEAARLGGVLNALLATWNLKPPPESPHAVKALKNGDAHATLNEGPQALAAYAKAESLFLICIKQAEALSEIERSKIRPSLVPGTP